MATRTGLFKRCLAKALISGYNRVRHGHTEHVGDYARADRAAIIDMLAERRAHVHQLAFDFGGAGGGTPAPEPQAGGGQPREAEPHAAAELPAARPAAAEQPLPREGRGRHATSDGRAERRKVFEEVFGHLADARRLEALAEAGGDQAADQLARAAGIRAELAGRLGPDYEKILHGRMVANYHPDIKRAVDGWATRMRVPLSTDDHGRPTGSYGQLVAEAEAQAAITLQNYKSSNRTPIYRLVIGQIKQHLFRYGREALGDGAFHIPHGVRDDLSRMSYLQEAAAKLNNEPMSDERLAEAMGLSVASVRELQRIQGQALTLALDKPAPGAEDGPTLADTLPAPGSDPARYTEQDAIAQDVHFALKQLGSVERATVMTAYDMPLDADTVADLVRDRQFFLLEHALKQTTGADPEARAREALAMTSWAADAPMDVRVYAATRLLEAGLDAHALLTPAEGEAFSVSELHRRLGLKPANSGSVQRTAEARLARNSRLASYRDVLGKSITGLDAWAALGPAEAILVAALRAAPDFVDCVIKALAADPAQGPDLMGIIGRITERDQSGELRVRGDRGAEAAILVAALVPGGEHGQLHGDSPRGEVPVG